MRKSSSNYLLTPAVRTLFLAFAVLLSGCYEGWEYDQKGGATPQPPKPPKPSIPVFFYILLEPIFLGPAAVSDPGCFPARGYSEYRNAEWAERIEALSAALAPLAVTFKVAPHAIGKPDCLGLAALKSAAIDPKPWAPDPGPDNDPLDRSLVDIRAVFWEGDVETDPLPVVITPQWAAFAAMAKAGRKAKTINHFILEHEAEGYFHSWLANISPSARVDGTPINNVDPSDAGKPQRTATVKADAATVAKWLTEHP